MTLLDHTCNKWCNLISLIKVSIFHKKKPCTSIKNNNKKNLVNKKLQV